MHLTNIRGPFAADRPPDPLLQQGLFFRMYLPFQNLGLHILNLADQAIPGFFFFLTIC